MRSTLEMKREAWMPKAKDLGPGVREDKQVSQTRNRGAALHWHKAPAVLD